MLLLGPNCSATVAKLFRVQTLVVMLTFVTVCFALTANVRAGFLYVLNQQNGTPNQIYGFNVAETTGVLTLLPGFPINSGGTGNGLTFSETVVIDRSNLRLYVLNDGSDTVGAFSINAATGALSPLPFHPLALGTGDWGTITVPPSGSPLMVGNGNLSPTVASFKITATTATAAAGSPYATGTGAVPFNLVLSRDGDLLYTGGVSGANFAGFKVDESSGILTALPGSPFNSGSSLPHPYGVDSRGRLFLGTGFDDQLRVYTTAGGVPTGVTGNPFPLGLTDLVSPVDGRLHPNEAFLYVTDRDGNRLSAFQISGTGSATTLAQVAGSPLSSGGGGSGMIVLNSAGSFLFAANNSSRNITTFGVDATTGVLTFNNVQPDDTLGTTRLLTGMDYLPPVFQVTNTNDSGVGSLRQAVTGANAGGGGIVNFSPLFDTPQTISLSTGHISISSNLTIAGKGADLLTVRNIAAPSSTSRVFNHVAGNVELRGMTISGGNVTGHGGGVARSGSAILLVSHCVISGNQAGNFGGGIESTGSAGMLNVNHSTISGNSTPGLDETGGGIEIANGTANLTNSTISGNSVTGGDFNGGGIMVFGSGNVTITNCTVTNNSTVGPGSASGLIRNGTAVVTVRSSIIAGNQNNNTQADVVGAFAASGGGYNLIGNAGTATGFNQTGDQFGSAATPLDPRLSPLSTHGGKFPVHIPLTGSPAIDKGDSYGRANDQRGITRPFDRAGISNLLDGSDIGAVERRPAVDDRAFDFDGDDRADISVFRPSNNTWFLLLSQAGFQSTAFGATVDQIAPADYDGDGKTDVAVYRPSNGTWFIINSSTNTFSFTQFGIAEDLPTPADYDGDGRADLSVFRPSSGTWFRLNSGNGSSVGFQFGANGDRPALGDFDGDGKADISVFRPSNGAWFRINSGDGTSFGTQFGISTDVITPADFDGDAKTDIAVFRPASGTWFRLNSSTGTFIGQPFGANGDIPAPGDFEGDGKADVCVFRPSDGNWYRLNSSNNAFVAQPFGANGDLPTPAAFR